MAQVNAGLKKLIVFANDPLKEYYLKGELTDRYFNAGDFFDEVYFISLTEKEIGEKQVQHTVGKAKLNIYPVGKIGPWVFFPFSAGRKRVAELIEQIDPCCFRAYNAHVQGFLGACMSVEYAVPLVVSLHTNPEKSIRAFLNPFSQPLRWMFWKLSKFFIEPFVLNRAKKIICVYNFIVDFAKGTCKDPGKIELIYNRIEMSRFKPVDRSKRDKLTILCVGRLYEQKNPRHLIKAMLNINAELVIIGDGPYRKRTQGMIKNSGLENKVRHIHAVPNKDIHKYYQDADIFVSVTDCGETSKVMIEAMASGLPVVINRTKWNVSELLEDSAIIVENSSLGFEKALKNLIENPAERMAIGDRNREKALKINSNIMEEKEMTLYKNILIRDELG
jgi:glycosyltransferase involved in cell wall biosynthesis